MAVKKPGDSSIEGTLANQIVTDLADNNAGQISARDVRQNILDTADSIVPHAASGDYVTYPFNNNNVNFNFLVVAKSGVKFDNDQTTGLEAKDKIQTEPYLGVTGIVHNALAGLTLGDHHSQYVSRSGCRLLTGNLGTGSEFINSSGAALGLPSVLQYDQCGISFSHTKIKQGGKGGGPTNREIVHIGSGMYEGEADSSTILQFDVDQSKMDSAKSTAIAWCHFDGTSGNISVQSSYNIAAVEASGDGTYKLSFKPGLLADGDSSYCVIAHANGTTGQGSARDMDLVIAAATLRNNEFFSLAIQNDGGQYVNAKVIDAVVYGLGSGTLPASGSIAITNSPT